MARRADLKNRRLYAPGGRRPAVQSPNEAKSLMAIRTESFAELTLEELDLATAFYQVARDYPAESFHKVKKRVLGDTGFRRSKHSSTFFLACDGHYIRAHDDMTQASFLHREQGAAKERK
jgi:hypothetical protein